MLKHLIGGVIAAAALSVASAHAQCGSYPNFFTNGTTADAIAVNSAFSCTAPLISPHFTGYVGINTPSPTLELEVTGNIGVVNGRYYWVNAGGTADALLGDFPGSPAQLILYNTDSSGAIYPTFSQTIRTLNAPILFYTQAEGIYNWATFSDIRLKKNIEPVVDALTTVLKIRGVRYDWRDASERTVGKTLNLPQGERQIGFIAQELEGVVPEAVHRPNKADEPYAVMESNLTPLLVEAIKEQEAKIDQLEAQVKALQGAH